MQLSDIQLLQGLLNPQIEDNKVVSYCTRITTYLSTYILNGIL